jgi:hypothetical protein
VSNWQQLAQQQAALQQQAVLQLLAPQLAGQPPASQHPAGIGGLSGIAGQRIMKFDRVSTDWNGTGTKILARRCKRR